MKKNTTAMDEDSAVLALLTGKPQGANTVNTNKCYPTMSSESGLNLMDQYVSKEKLAEILNIPVRSIEKNSFKIPGRVKIGKHVRYRLADIYKRLQSKKSLYS